MSEWNTDIRLIAEDLRDLRKALDGEEVEGLTEDESYIMSAMEIFEAIDDMCFRLRKIQHSVISQHIQLLEENHTEI